MKKIIITILMIIALAFNSFGQSAVIYAPNNITYNKYYHYYHQNPNGYRIIEPHMTNANKGNNRIIKANESTLIEMGAFNRIRLHLLAHDTYYNQSVMWVFHDGNKLAEKNGIATAYPEEYFIWIAHPGNVAIYFNSANPEATLELKDIELYKE